jgi:hypothetical protein
MFEFFPVRVTHGKKRFKRAFSLPVEVRVSLDLIMKSMIDCFKVHPAMSGHICRHLDPILDDLIIF